jgi:CubicO group peptidase (beta-lactamase class C family)
VTTFNACVALAAFSLACSGVSNAADGAIDKPAVEKQIADVLRGVRDRAQLPGLAGAIVTSDGQCFSAVVGVRRTGSAVAVTPRDSWHLGSNTKAMTATLIGILIDDGKLKFESTVAEVFPELAPALPERMRAVTVEQLMNHQSGLPHDPADGWGRFMNGMSITDQRLAAVRAMASDAKMIEPGKTFAYSNWGYVVLGAMAERVTGRRWERLIRERVFAPLNMQHVGIGGMGTPGMIDQPWPHRNGKPMEQNGPGVDNPPVMAPAGEVHCPITEWAKYVANELRGFRGEPSLVSVETFRRLHTPAAGESYGGGWGGFPRSWARGTAYTHAGSNTMNFSVAWLAPVRGLAVMACTNEGEAAKPCDDAVGALIGIFEQLHVN